MRADTMGMKNGVDERTVLYITRIDCFLGQEPVVHYRLEPVRITYCEWKVIDAVPSSERAVEEGTVAFADYDHLVRAKGYLDARREWLPLLMELQRKYGEWAAKELSSQLQEKDG